MHPDVVVVGSANSDVRLDVRRLPRPGETVLAQGRSSGLGGKGANQAVAAARSGARTCFIGAVGDDAGGEVLRAELAAAGVDVTHVRGSASGTGTAFVVVDEAGENLIVVDPGANASLVGLDEDELAVAAHARVLLCQLEVPVTAVTAAASAAQGTVVLNAAPAQRLPRELTGHVDVLVVNEDEARAVAGDPGSVESAVERLLLQVPAVLVTLGVAGVLVARRDGGSEHLPVVPARQVVDTTGAGDTFCGALAAAIATGAELVAAARRATVAASLSVEQAGAARSAPTSEQVRNRLAELGLPDAW